jgi:protein O-GlcNAc transferase
VPTTVPDLLSAALAAHQRGDLLSAEQYYRRILASDGRHFDAMHMLGVIEAARGNFRKAAAQISEALEIEPGAVGAFINLGRVQAELGENDAAIESFETALKLDPRSALAHDYLSIVLRRTRQVERALQHCDKALQIERNSGAIWSNRGNILYELGRLNDALTSYGHAIAISPRLAEAHLGRGNVLRVLARNDEARGAYDRALALDPTLAEAWAGSGFANLETKRYPEALAAFEKALAIRPDLQFLLGTHMLARMMVCDWRGFDEARANLIAAVQAGRLASTPMPMLAIPCSLQDHLDCAQAWSAASSPKSSQRLWRGERYTHERLRIAYVSPDLREHPVAYLMAGVFEHHDRARFETVAISVGVDDKSEMRSRLQGLFDRFVDVRNHSDYEAARAIRELEVDILIDLMGSNAATRPAIMVFRPAPIQVNYLSYPGIVGTGGIDYVLADRFVIPESEQGRYREPIVCLPHTYIGYDTKRTISDRTPDRKEMGLPETGFVFCAYNNSYKITPYMFDVWMRLLRQIEGSVLWLYRENAVMVDNLRREAQTRGVDPERLVFAPFVKLFEDHMARYRVVDLFLDAQPYTAVTTACDALWAGLPIVTCYGDTYPARVSASLLNAVGLPELVTANFAEYEALALKLAREPELLAGIRAKLARNRDTYPLFDSVRFTRHIEAAYETMWEIQQRGERPRSFSVEPMPKPA